MFSSEEDHEAKFLFETKMQRYREATARERTSDFPYIPDNAKVQELDHFCDLHQALIQPLESHILQVLSAPGFGKTSFLQHWVQQREVLIKLGQSDGTFMFFHFVHSSQDENLSDMLGSLEYELKAHFHLRDMVLRKTPNQRRWDLPRFLDAASRKSRGVLLIVIDGLSRLKMENGEEADPMLWLPRDLPKNVRVIVSLTEFLVPHLEASPSTLAKWKPVPTRSFIELERRSCPCIHLGHMPQKSMHSILGSYARFHAACFHLSQEQIRTIMNNEGSSHPLYLHILLNSLRTIASLACLPDIAVNHVLSKVQNIHHVEGLLSLVLELCEKDVEMNVDGTDKGLLPRVLSLLYVSHKGLSEDELFEALNDIHGMNAGVKHRESIRIILNDLCMVIEVQNVIHMENEAVRRVVWRKYISTNDARKEHHHILAHFFYRKNVCIRRIEELPWHYERLEEYSHLRDIMTDVDTFQLWWDSIPHRPELLRIWGFLCLPPTSFDLTMEYNAMFEKQCISRGMDDTSRTKLFMNLSLFFFQFSRDGYEEAADCPPLQHSDLGWSELQHNGISVMDNKHEGDHIQDTRPAKSPRKKRKKAIISTAGSMGLSGANGNEDDETSRHPCYNYYRWIWIQFPWLLIGLYKRWAILFKTKKKELSDKTSGKTPGIGTSKQSVRKDPIVLRLENLAIEKLHKAEEAKKQQEEDDDKAMRQEAALFSSIPKEMSAIDKIPPRKTKLSSKPNNGSPYRIVSPGKKTRRSTTDPAVLPKSRIPHYKNRVENDHGVPSSKKKKQNKWVIKFTSPSETPAQHESSSDEGEALNDGIYNKMKPGHKQHVNGGNILDLDKRDKWESKVVGMTGGTVSMRNSLNTILLVRRRKQKELQHLMNELLVLDGLEEGEQMSAGRAYNLLNKMDEIKGVTSEAEVQIEHYKYTIDVCQRFPANNADWLEQIDLLKERLKSEEAELLRNIRKSNDEIRQLNVLIPQAKAEHERERHLQEAFIARLKKQHEIEEKDRERAMYFEMRQKNLLAADIVRKRQAGQGSAKKKVVVKGAVTKIRKSRFKNRVAVWEERVRRLRQASGGMDIADILSMLSNFSQDDVHSNLNTQMELQTQRIARLEDARERLLVRLKSEMRNKTEVTAGVVLANKDEELTRVRTKVDAAESRYMHFQQMLTKIRAGLDHLVTILKLDISIAGNPLDVLQKIRESLVEKINFLEPMVPDLVKLVTEDEANRVRSSALAVDHNMIGKDLNELQLNLWTSKNSSMAKLNDQRWVSKKIHVDLKRIEAVKADRPFTPDMMAEKAKIPIISLQRRQFTMDQDKLASMLNDMKQMHVKDTVISRKQMKLVAEESAHKATAKRMALAKRKEKEDQEKWIEYTGGPHPSFG